VALSLKILILRVRIPIRTATGIKAMKSDGFTVVF
jgi:hypothetical protein